MATDLAIYSALNNAPIIEFDDSGSIEDDIIFVLNIEGLDPVQASINGLDSGSDDGVDLTSPSVGSRNIVITLYPNPDYNSWTFRSIRKALYKYFTPKSFVHLVFTNDEVGEVYIDGIVESVSGNPFTKNPEFVTSIICPKPYFVSTETKTVEHEVSAPDTWEDNNTREVIEIDGNIEIGFKLRITEGFNSDIIIQVGRSLDPNVPPEQTFRLHLDSTGKLIEVNSVKGQRSIRSIDPDTGVYSNIMGSLLSSSVWPTLLPGTNVIAVTSADNISLGGATWKIDYIEKYGAI